jgi:hypothetical protein
VKPKLFSQAHKLNGAESAAVLPNLRININDFKKVVRKK